MHNHSLAQIFIWSKPTRRVSDRAIARDPRLKPWKLDAGLGLALIFFFGEKRFEWVDVHKAQCTLGQPRKGTISVRLDKLQRWG